MNVLGLDLGTKTGWSLWTPKTQISGTWILGKSKLARDFDPRVEALLRKLVALIDSCDGLDWTICFEDVQFSSYVYQVQLWASLRGALWCLPWCVKEARITFRPVPVKTLKQFATGRGDAGKNLMAGALTRVNPNVKLKRLNSGLNLFAGKRKIDDNEVDAIWLMQYAIQKYEPAK